MLNLHEEVSMLLVRATSKKYVTEPGKNDILLDAIIGLWRFSNFKTPADGNNFGDSKS
jgi:hypothetical protein